MWMSEAEISAAMLGLLLRIVFDHQEFAHARRDEFLDAIEYRIAVPRRSKVWS